MLDKINARLFFQRKTPLLNPALQELINLGYEYLTPKQAFQARRKKLGNILLENILRSRIKKINRIHYRGGEYLFSEENIQSAVQKIKNVRYDRLLKTNEAVYGLLTLGTATQQNRAIYSLCRPERLMELSRLLTRAKRKSCATSSFLSCAPLCSASSSWTMRDGAQAA